MYQPWASLVAVGAKTIETRSWSTRHRGPLAIHAAASVPTVVFAFLDGRHGAELRAACAKSLPTWRPGQRNLGLPSGAVIATCNLADVVRIAKDDPESWPPDEREAHVAWSASGSGIASAIAIVGGGQPAQRREGERPLGDYLPGRFAWLLDDTVELAEPAPARGRQQLWSWEP